MSQITKRALEQSLKNLLQQKPLPLIKIPVKISRKRLPLSFISLRRMA